MAANHSHFSGLVPTLPAPISPCRVSPHADTHPLPQVLGTRRSCVRGNGISWSLRIITGHFMRSPTHTLSLHPALARSLEKEQNRPCSLGCPVPSPSLSSPPLFFSLLPPSTSVHSALSQGGVGESPVSVQPVWWCWGVSSHSSLLSPSPPPLPPTLTAGCHRHHYNPVTDFPIDHSSPLWTAVC